MADTAISPQRLGCAVFRQDYGLGYSYAAGSMYKGIASAALVAAMSRGGLLSFLGTGGMRDQEVVRQLGIIRAQTSQATAAWGVNLLCDLGSPQREQAQVDLYLSQGVRLVEASAFMTVTPALVRYRLSGLTRQAGGDIICNHRMMAKVSRHEVAQLFMQPAPAKLVAALRDSNCISREQAEWAAHVPLADDICVEGDSGGHTDRGVTLVLLPTILSLRDAAMRAHHYTRKICVGAAGGLGTPQSVAAAFMLGADFVLTGSINQCTVEAGTSDAVKDILQEMSASDTDYAPAGDMFEVGAKVQVLRRGIMFAARANRLYELYRRHESLDSMDESTRRQLADRIFQRPLHEVWAETQRFYAQHDPRVLQQAEAQPKKKMALLFKWYFVHTTRLALQGEVQRQVDFQVHCGPALGAFNQWAGAGPLQSWRNRHVQQIAVALMQGAAQQMHTILRGALPEQYTAMARRSASPAGNDSTQRSFTARHVLS